MTRADETDDRYQVFPNGKGNAFTGRRVDVREGWAAAPDSKAAVPGRKHQEILSQGPMPHCDSHTNRKSGQRKRKAPPPQTASGARVSFSHRALSKFQKEEEVVQPTSLRLGETLLSVCPVCPVGGGYQLLLRRARLVPGEWSLGAGGMKPAGDHCILSFRRARPHRPVSSQSLNTLPPPTPPPRCHLRISA